MDKNLSLWYKISLYLLWLSHIKANVSRIPNVLQDPAPDVEILEFTMAEPVLAVRPYCNNDHYWQVYFDTNKAIRETFTQAGYPAPEESFSFNTSLPNGKDSNPSLINS